MSATHVSTGRSASPTPTVRAGQWFLTSGIQERSGGVARYYLSDAGRNARLSTEITGYAVSTFAYLYVRTGEIEYLDAARASADFLLRRAWDSALGIFPFEYPPDGHEQLAYFFDTGIIVRGLLALWRITGDADLLEGAVKGGESLDRDFTSDYHPILRLPSKEPLPYEAQWSRSPGCYQLKSALCWHDLARAPRQPDWNAKYEAALAQALLTQETFLPAETIEKTMDRLHSYCYFLESMYPVHDRPEVRAALRTGIERTASYLRSIRATFERSDVYAQLLRVRLLAHQSGAVPLDHADAEEEARRISAFQLSSDDPRIDGGFAFGRKRGEIMPFVNPVSTGFCLQALEMWRDHLSGKHIDAGSLI